MTKSPFKFRQEIPLFVWFIAGSFFWQALARDPADWPQFGGDAEGSQFSLLDQITPENVAELELAWSWTHKEVVPGFEKTQIQTNPIVIAGRLFGVTHTLDAFALDAATGKLLWRFSPDVTLEDRRRQGVNRGVVFYDDGGEGRIFYSLNNRLFALNAGDGSVIRSFGENGEIDLRESLGRNLDGAWVLATTPGIIYRDLLIQGTRVSEGGGAAPGSVRAYDCLTGEMRWIFHTIPRTGEFGADTWPKDAWKHFGGVNCWAGMALDRERGIVYVPTGSASYDYWGGDRPGENLFANSLVALDAQTGERIWHYQTVHHDIFDRDLPSHPNLITLERNGETIDAVAQTTKSGYVFVFDRETGEPLYPIEEIPVPRSTLLMEATWPTQPQPVKPVPFARQSFPKSDINDHFPEVFQETLERYEQLDPNQGPFTPSSEKGAIFIPGLDGGAEWGGSAVDPEKGVLYVNSNNMPWVLTSQPFGMKDRHSGYLNGRKVYEMYCLICHGEDRRGDGNRYPSLLGLHERNSVEQVFELLDLGRGFMPSFRQLSPIEKKLVTAYLLEQPPALVPLPEVNQRAEPEDEQGLPNYGIFPERFLDSRGYPAVKPPWGELSAIDLNSGEYLWKIPLGEFPELTEKGIPVTGTENYGGPALTGGGVLFIAATRDEKFRAIDASSGEILWEYPLPAGGYATPSVYAVDGRQFVVIAAGGGKMGTPSGDSYLAFALPDPES